MNTLQKMAKLISELTTIELIQLENATDVPVEKWISAYESIRLLEEDADEVEDPPSPKYNSRFLYQIISPERQENGVLPNKIKAVKIIRHEVGCPLKEGVRYAEGMPFELHQATAERLKNSLEPIGWSIEIK